MTRLMLVILLVVPLVTFAQEQKETSKETSSNLRQYYSGKFGFYQPSDGLNNGLMFGIDGITEFLRYNFVLTGAVDLYTKQTIGIFNKDPKPNVLQQAIVLLPLHVNAGMQLFNVPDADSRGYAGVGHQFVVNPSGFAVTFGFQYH